MEIQTSVQLWKLNRLLAMYLIQQGVPPEDVHEVVETFDGSGSGEPTGWESHGVDQMRLVGIGGIEDELCRLRMIADSMNDELQRTREMLSEKTLPKPESGWTVLYGFGMAIVLGWMLAFLFLGDSRHELKQLRMAVEQYGIARE